MRIRFWIAALLCALPAGAANRVSVTVVDAKSGKPALGLKAEDFTLYEDKLARKADAAEFSSDIVDVMLLFDTSLVGETVRPVADDFVAQLKPKEQMAIVAFHSSADPVGKGHRFGDLWQYAARARRAVCGHRHGNEECHVSAGGGDPHDGLRGRQPHERA